MPTPNETRLKRGRVFICAGLVLLTLIAATTAGAQEAVPPALHDWESWVLHGHGITAARGSRPGVPSMRSASARGQPPFSCRSTPAVLISANAGRWRPKAGCPCREASSNGRRR